jgi:hypothetical protein
MKHLSILTLTMIALSSFMATTVQADNPHFVRGPTPGFDSSTGEFCVTFTEAGLGNLPITYTLSVGTEMFTFQCFTRHGNTPQGDPNGQSFSDQSVSTTITPHNGRIRGSLCLEPQVGDADCQGHGLVLKLIAASYQDVTFCDQTNNLCFDMGDAGGSVVPPVPFP